MKCPVCGGEFDGVTFRSRSGSSIYAKRCNQCSGFWFEREPASDLELSSVLEQDSASANYSMKNTDLVCPQDQSLLEEVDSSELPAGSRYWRCNDCDGSFYPKGQLATLSEWRAKNSAHVSGGPLKPNVAISSVLVVALVGLVGASAGKISGFSAATDQVLPTLGPSLGTLILLAVTYVAGTILAILGRKVAVVAMGWGVISICLVGFFVVIFGP